MLGALHTITRIRIPDRETDGAGLRLAVIRQDSASELKASYKSLMQLCWWGGS
jgi:hypothetical protein